MSEASRVEMAPTFVTIGPQGTDHERATKRYIKLQGLEDIARIELEEDIIGEGPERVLGDENKFLVLCSAHPKVHIVTERYPQELVVIDEFIDATRDLSLIIREGVEVPETLALVEATQGYTDLEKWKEQGTEIIDAQSKPVIARMLVDGECEAGLTFTNVCYENPGFRIEENYGEVRTTWVVFGDVSRSTFKGDVIGTVQPELFTGPAGPAS